MRSKQHRLMKLGSFLALSTFLLLAALTVQASARHTGDEGNAFVAKLPPKGSVYAIDLVGQAKIPGKGMVKQASADIELKVVNVKSTGIPTAFLQLTSGKFSLGNDVYTLEKGTATIQANKVNIKATSKDGTKILTVTATLVGSLPVSTTEGPVKLVPGQDRKSASIQIFATKWLVQLGGSISRTA